MKFFIPKRKLFKAALKLNRWPVNWFDPKKDKEKERQERIKKLYPKKCKPYGVKICQKNFSRFMELD